MKRSTRWVALIGAMLASCAETPSEPQQTSEEAAQCSAATAWKEWTAYRVGDVVTFGGASYQCIQAHTSQPDWTPSAVPALWGAVSCSGSPPPSNPPPSN